jgi:uncharacterized protein (DUF488 family)
MAMEEHAMAESLVVFTIGHSNHPSDRFLDLLECHQIQAVVDVRSVPFSRFAPHFNGPELQLLLGQRGIQYVFAGEILGGRPSDPMYYKTGVIPEGKADYLSIVDYPAIAQQPWYQRGVQRLVDIAATRATAIMCSEENPLRCHRHYLIENSLRDRDAKVVHIRRDGTLEMIGSEETEPVAVQSPQLALAGFGE